MENANGVISTQNLLLLIGIVLWFLPCNRKGSSPFSLPVWPSSRLPLYSLMGLLGVLGWLLGLGFLLPFIACIAILAIAMFTGHQTPLEIREVWEVRKISAGGIIKSPLVGFLSHWPILLLVYWISSMLLPDAEPQKSIEVLREGTWIQQIKIAFLALVIAPLTEEFFFRGILYRTLKSFLALLVANLPEKFFSKGIINHKLRPLLSIGPAMVLTSFAFAAVHLNLFAFAPLFALSFFLILVYERTGHLAVPIIYHAIFNSLTVIFVIWGTA